jgi:hypothetical protein
MSRLRRDESVQPAVQAVEAETTGDAMQPGNDLTFGPFCLDVTQGQLWRGAQVLALRPRSLAMLRYLAEHPGRLVTKAEMRWSEAEVSRLQGEIQLQLASPEIPQAEAWFQQAIDVARRQQAKALELRAALSLARLWQRQGKCDKARQSLAEVYGWFTEGFDTPDLQEARVLLQELA